MTTNQSTAHETPAAHQSSRWLTALTTASDDLRQLVESLTERELSQQSHAADWTIAQVLSHLGSAAEICSELVRRGLDGDDHGPRREDLVPVWDRWNSLSPLEQREQWQTADRKHADLIRGITSEQEQTLRVPYFAGPMDLTTYLGYRLSEHALHGWDIAGVLDPSARVTNVDLIWERIDLIANRFHDASVRSELAPRHVVLNHDARQDRLEVLDAIHVIPGDETPARAAATLTGTTDVLTRLIYGRLRASDTLDITGSITREQLVRLFPGF